MHLRIRPLWLAAAALVMISGCAGQRYDYTGSYAGAGEYYPSIIDWNFPTTTSQGPLEPPQRLIGYRPAIGVPWATGEPLPWRNNLAPAPDAAPRSDAPHEDVDACATDCNAVTLADDAPYPDAPLVSASRSN